MTLLRVCALVLGLSAASVLGAPFDFAVFQGIYKGKSTVSVQGDDPIPGAATATFRSEKNSGSFLLSTIYNSTVVNVSFSFTRKGRAMTISTVAPGYTPSTGASGAGAFKAYAARSFLRGTVPWTYATNQGATKGLDVLTMQVRKSGNTQRLIIRLLVHLKDPSFPKYEVFTWNLVKQ